MKCQYTSYQDHAYKPPLQGLKSAELDYVEGPETAGLAFGSYGEVANEDLIADRAFPVMGNEFSFVVV